VKRIVAWVKGLKAYRVYQIYSERGGNLSAAGMSFQALFATLAAVWVGFSIAAFVVQGDARKLQALITFIDSLVPHLIDSGGLIDPAQLITNTALGITSVISLLIVGYTALKWMDFTRVAIRKSFDLPVNVGNFFFRKVRDLVIALLFGLAILISTAVSLASTNLLTDLLHLIGIEDSTTLNLTIAITTAIILAVFDTALLAGLIRFLSSVIIPARQLWIGSLLGGIALGILKILAELFLGGASRNPLLAGFAIFIGVLIWFNLVARIYLMSVAWIAVSLDDQGIRPGSAERRPPQRLTKTSPAKTQSQGV